MSTQIRTGEISNFNAGVIASTLTGYLSGSGTISSADSILQAIQKLNGNIAAISGATGANPTGTIGLVAVNGSSTNFIRSDGAPALSQAITPTWTGVHIFNQNNITTTANDAIIINNTTASTVSVTLQYSPALNFAGTAWNTTAVASQVVNFRIYNLTQTGSSIGGLLAIDASLNGGAYSNAITISNAGGITALGNITTSGGGFIGNAYSSTANNVAVTIQGTRTFNAAINAVSTGGGVVTNSTGQFVALLIQPSYTQTSTASATDLLINRTETSVGSGTQLLFDAQVASTSKFQITNKGLTTINATGNATTTTDGFVLQTSVAATAGVQVQYSPRFRIQGQAWNTTSVASQPLDYFFQVEPNSGSTVSSLLAFYSLVNGASQNKIFGIDNFGDVSFYNSFFMNKTGIAAVSTDGFVYNNTTASTLAVPVQKSTRTRFVGSVWNTTATAAANYFGFTEEATGVSGLVPTAELDWYGYIGVSSTPTFTKLMSLDAATGNLTLLSGKLTISSLSTGLLHSNASGVISSSLVGISDISATGTPSGSTYLRGDNVWSTVSASPAGSTTQVQYNNAGAAAGASQVFIESDGNLALASQGTGAPTTPTLGIKVFDRIVAGRHMLAQVGLAGVDTALQPLLARNKIGYWNPQGNATTVPGVFGLTAPTTTGTATSRTVAVTNGATRMRRLGYVSATTAAALAYQYINVAQFSGGSGTSGDNSGFFLVSRFVPSDAATVSGERFFVGMSSSTSAPTNVEPNTLTNCIGMAQLSTDSTQFYLVYGGSSAQTAIAMGTGLGSPVGASVAAFEFAIFCNSATANTFYVQATNLLTGVVYTNTLTGSATVIPQSGTLLAWRIWKCNNATALACAYDLCSMYIETDY